MHVTFMLRAWGLSVRLSVCNIGGLWSHSATKSELIGTWQDRSVSWLQVCMWKPTRIIISYNPSLTLYTDENPRGRENVEFCTSVTKISLSDGLLSGQTPITSKDAAAAAAAAELCGPTQAPQACMSRYLSICWAFCYKCNLKFYFHRLLNFTTRDAASVWTHN